MNYKKVLIMLSYLENILLENILNAENVLILGMFGKIKKFSKYINIYSSFLSDCIHIEAIQQFNW